MGLFKLPEGARFSNKTIVKFMLPIFLEQLMIAGLRMADTYMVSSLGDGAMAGVSLSSTIDSCIKQVFIALATGGSVVVSQYIGAKDNENSQRALRSNIRILFLFGFTLSVIMLLFKNPFLHALFGSVEPDVMAYCKEYYLYAVASYSFLALYNVGTASFRAMGQSFIPLVGSISMMVISLVFKYIFIFILHMGVKGASLSNMLALVIVGVAFLILLYGKKSTVRLSGLFKLSVDKQIVKRICNVAIPNGIENGMFEFGLLIIQSLISTLGTAAIAANSVAKTLTPLIYSISAAFTMTIIVLVGRCMGAGKPDEAQFYTKHILKLDYFFTAINGVILVLCSGLLVSLFKDVSPEARTLAQQIAVVYYLGTMLLYPTSFAMANALRGAGDTKFVMTVAVTTMFAIRIGVAYIFVLVFKWGVLGTWYAMLLDWLLRSTIFCIRFKKGKWKKIKVI